jgi:hypothetical protein
VAVHVYDGTLIDLVGSRKGEIAEFLTWSARREAGAGSSLRLSNRGDVARVKNVIELFGEPWWGVVVYSCFDSEIGTRAVAQAFHDPVSPGRVASLLATLHLPPGSVQDHRTQPGHKGARVALTAACEHATAMRQILLEGVAFHDRYLALRGLQAKQWGRTTCFDLLVRAGQLGIGSRDRYQPDRAYLADSTGPRRGFRTIWGIEVSRSNADQCEQILHSWIERWHETASQVGVPWSGEPYSPGDLENALCIYQERGSPGYGKRDVG